jgi:glucokinase
MTTLPLYIGIDIGGTKTAGGIVTDEGEVLERYTLPTPALDGQGILNTAMAVAEELLKHAAEPVLGIGIGAAGQIDAVNGTVVYATDIMPTWAGVDVRGPFEARFGIPTKVDNDVNALAVGESRLGAARGLATVVFLALGTGVGGGLVQNGQVHYGAHWSGGEFGNIIINLSETEPCPTGAHPGSLEAYASGAGLVRTWRALSGDHTSETNGRAIAAEAARDPGSIAAEAVRKTGEYLGYGMASLANALDPDAIVIGGGLASLGEMLMEPARRIFNQWAMDGPRDAHILLASLGPDASTIGAAALAMPSSS